MRTCEKCKIEHDGSYGSGRFCSSKCSRSYSTSMTRQKINDKVSTTLSKKIKKIEKICPICFSNFSVKPSRSYRKTCSKKCGSKLSNSYHEKREALSTARSKYLINGPTNFKSLKCIYMFNEIPIRCDSKLEYACLNYFETKQHAIEMRRCDESIKYNDNGQIRRYIPDFIITTPEGCFIVECKSTIKLSELNETWRKYNEQAIVKNQILIDYAEKTNRKPFWFTQTLHYSYYKKIKPDILLHV